MMSEVRDKEIEIRARLMAELLQAQGVVLFHDFPKDKSNFWEYASEGVEVLAVFPKSEWKRIKDLLNRSGWRFSASSKMVAYLGRGRKMRKVLVLTYYTDTGLYPYPHAFVHFIWYGDDIMMGVAATRYADGWERVDSVLLEQYGVNLTYARMFLEDVGKEKLACVRVRG